jgi:hypothetical protein
MFSQNQNEQHDVSEISANESVYVKMMSLGLVVVDQVNFQRSTTTKLESAEVLLSIEATLKSWWLYERSFQCCVLSNSVHLKEKQKEVVRP